ncbi:hypothetical protein [Stenotrophomonas sp. CFBP8994]|uniref:hypothetical protein n=1 Tax=Stenotrophomonas sp. CFBP8994 TaxID=3096527 RepID=UPI003BEECAF8
MLINALDIARTGFGTDKAQPPLGIDADGVLAAPSPFSCFNAVAGCAAQERQDLRSIEHPQHAFGGQLEPQELPGATAFEQGERMAAATDWIIPRSVLRYAEYNTGVRHTPTS